MKSLLAVIAYLLFPGGLFVVVGSLAYEYVDRKLIARFQNRVGPRWFQPLADFVKLLVKEEIIPQGVNPGLFIWLPVVALAAALATALYVPMAGLSPTWSFRGDVVATVYLLMMMTLCIGLAGANTSDRFSVIGAVRALTQLFSYEAPFLLALLGPAVVAGSWRIAEINVYAQGRLWMIVTQPFGFLVALIGLMGKLELPPFDAPEAETEIVSGALTEYSGRGLAFFRLGRDIELFVGLTLISAFYLGGLANPLQFLLKTLALLFVTAGLQSLVRQAAHRPDRRPVVAGWRLAGAGPAPHPDRAEDHGGRPMMRIGSMLGDIMRSLVRRPFTERYPFVVQPAPERTRGRLEWDEEKCTRLHAVREGLPGGCHPDHRGGQGRKEVHLPLPHGPLRLLRPVRRELPARGAVHVTRALAPFLHDKGVVCRRLRGS